MEGSVGGEKKRRENCHVAKGAKGRQMRDFFKEMRSLPEDW